MAITTPPPFFNDPHALGKDTILRNYTSLVSTNGSYDVCSSVGAPPPDTSIADQNNTTYLNSGVSSTSLWIHFLFMLWHTADITGEGHRG